MKSSLPTEGRLSKQNILRIDLKKKTFIFCGHQADSVENQTKDMILELVELQKSFDAVVSLSRYLTSK